MFWLWLALWLATSGFAASQPVPFGADSGMTPTMMAPPTPGVSQQQQHPSSSSSISVGTANPQPPAPPVPAAAAALNRFLTCYIPTNITSGPQQLCSMPATVLFSQTPEYFGFPVLPVCARYQHQCIGIDLMSLHNATVCSPADVANGTFKWVYQVVPNMELCQNLGKSTGTANLHCCAGSLCNAPISYLDRNTTITGRPCNLTATVLNMTRSALGR